MKVLEEGEVHLGFSKTFFDPQTKFQDTILHNLDVVVARSPALLPSDIQRVKAVFKPELRGLKDVVVFSAKGASPLASMLSGGDYDGDRVWICWDQSIVDKFTNASMPLNPPDLAALGITQDTTTVAELASNGNPMTAFLQRSFDFCLEPNLLGICTSHHEQMCYAKQSIQWRGAVIIATLLGYLVDREKQGLHFTEEDWQRLRERYPELNKHPPKPAYKDGPNLPTNHIIDFLVFKIARAIREETLQDFAQTLKDVPSWDPDLAALYKQEDDDAAGVPEVKEVLRQLTGDISEVYDYWRQNCSASDEDKAKEGRFSALVEETYSRFCSIMPPAQSKHPLVSHWRLDAERAQCSQANGSVSQWSLLRASAAFMRHHNRGKFLWYVAGRELGILKAGKVSRGKWRAVVEPIYASLKPDAGYVKRIGKRREYEALFGSFGDEGS